MLKVRYRDGPVGLFQWETFQDSDYLEAQERYEEAKENWKQVELILLHQDEIWSDLVVLENQGLD